MDSELVDTIKELAERLRIAEDKIAVLEARDTYPKCNWEGGGPPTLSDDETQGYRTGSFWFDVGSGTNDLYILKEPNAGSANWVFLA